MKNFIPHLKYVIEKLLEHFAENPISVVFFVFIFCVFLLNIIRKIFIWREKKDISKNERCKYLINEEGEQDCDIPSQRKQFRKNGNSCAGCRHRTLEMPDNEVEDRVAMSYVWKYTIILLANYSRNILPYISFLYTLTITVFGGK